jgi:hypothetical protein
MDFNTTSTTLFNASFSLFFNFDTQGKHLILFNKSWYITHTARFTEQFNIEVVYKGIHERQSQSFKKLLSLFDEILSPRK